MSEPLSASPGYDFLYSADYYTDLTARVAATEAGGRIALATMNFNPQDEKIKELFSELSDAAVRGVDVNLAVDSYNFMFDRRDRPTGPLVFGRSLSSRNPYFQEKRDTLAGLEQNGATVGVINMPRSRFHIPHAGRSHIKGAVVNNTWRIGGCNLDATDFADAMVGNDSETTADYLYDRFSQLAVAGNVQAVFGEEDVVIPLDDTTKLIFDVGKRGQSEIYRRALSLINNAPEHIFLTCQYFPGGPTGKRLANALDRNVNTYAFFNGDHGHVGGTVMKWLRFKDKLRLPADLFVGQLPSTTPFLHAKLAASPTEAIVASHNMVNAGVLLGTAEAALHSTDPAFAQKTARMVLQCVNKTDDPQFAFLAQ